MKHKTGSFILFLSKAIFFLALVSAFFFGQRYFYDETLYYFWGNNILLLLYAAFLYLSNRIYRGFDFGNATIQEIIISWILCLVIVNVLQYFILSLTYDALLPVNGFAFMLGVQVVFVVPVAIVINAVYYRVNPAQSTLIIYGDIEKLQIYKIMIARQYRNFRVVDVVSQHEQTGALLDAVNNVQSVFFLDVDESIQDGLLEYCYLNCKHTYVLPTFSRVLYYTAGTLWLSNTPVFALTKPEPNTGTLMIKRLIDIIVSITAIILTSPIMLIVWVAVRLHDGHPAIYKQERITKGEKRFNIYKFRSMIPNAEDDGVPRLTTKDDSRITPIGRVIRKTRIDELPQLFNVLSGAMSIVGPRPERPEISEKYVESCPNFAFRTKVKAGITGFAQVFGRYNSAPEEKLFLDIMYIETFSILQDIKLMLQTISVLFKPLSTEGIENDSTTALR